MRSASDVGPGEDISTATLILTNTIKRELRERAAEEGRSQSEIARQALAAYLRK